MNIGHSVAHLIFKNPGLAKIISDFRLRNHIWFNGINVILTYKCNISCPYCYEKGIKYNYKDMSVEDFRKIVFWLKKNKRNKVILLGGEPTQHPNFVEIIKVCEENDLQVVVLTNLACDEPVLDAMINYRGVMIRCQVNINNPATYRNNAYDLIHRNLVRLKKCKGSLLLRYNIYQDNSDFRNIIDLAKKFNCSIRFSLVNSPLSCETSIKKNDNSIKDIYSKQKIVRFIEACNSEKVNAFFARPVPKCIFSRREIKKYRNNAIKFKCYVGRNGDYTARLNVNPDLSVMGCYGVPIIGPKLTSFNNISELNDYYKRHYVRLRAIPAMQECVSCEDFINDNCQGGCLSEKEKWDI